MKSTYQKKGMVVQWNLCNSLAMGCTLQSIWMSLLGNRLQPMTEKAQILKGRPRILSPFPCTGDFSSMMNTQKYQNVKQREHGQHPWQCKNVTDAHGAEFCYKETKEPEAASLCVTLLRLPQPGPAATPFPIKTVLSSLWIPGTLAVFRVECGSQRQPTCSYTPGGHSGWRRESHSAGWSQCL